MLQNADLTLNGTRGIIQFTRMALTGFTSPGPFGIGGDHIYDLQLDNTVPVSTAASFNLVMPNGRRFPFVRQPNGTLINTVTPSMQGAVFTTASNNSATLRYKNGVVYAFQTTGGLPPALSSITSPNGNTITLSHNPSAPLQITAISDAVGRQLTINYDNVGNGRITSIFDPLGRAVRYTYNAAGYLATVTDANGGVTQYAYDSNGNLTTVTDPRGVVVEQNTFDANGRIISQVQADGNAIQLSYTLSNPLAGTSPVMSTVVTDQLGRQTTYRFSSQGYLIQVTDATGQSRIFNRQPGTNLLLGTTGPGTCPVCGNTAAGDVTYTYDAKGNVLTSTDSLGNTFTYTYDPTFSKVTSITDPTGAVAHYQYDTNGNLTAVIDPRGNQTTIAIGSFGLPTSITDPTNQTTTFQYDSSGDPISIRDPLGNTTTLAYDQVSRPTQLTDPLGAQFSRTWDPLDRLISQTDALGGTTQYAYDAIGDPVSLADPRRGVTTFTYDALARATKRVDPLNRQWVFAYDAVGNLTSFTDQRGQTSQFTYDSLNRLSAETYPDATVSRTYDANGRLTQVNDSQGGVFSYQYDSAGRLLRSVAPQGAIAYVRDGLGRMTSRQVVGEPQATYQYDAASNLTQAAMAAVSVSVNMGYDARNFLTSQSRSNGVSSAVTYDPLARVLSIVHQAGSNVLANFSYTYDAAGNQAGVTTNLAQALTTQATTGTFDAANQMSTFGGRTFTNDSNGNRLTDVGPGGTTTYSWDGRNRLQSITQPNGTVTSFTYDFHRILTQQSVSGGGTTTTTSYLVDDITNVVAIYGGSTGTLSLLTGTNVDAYLATVNSLGQAQFAVNDAQGTVAGNSGSSAALDGKSLYEPFGQTTSTGTSFPFAFTGRVPVTSTIYYYRARFYDSTTGRFLSEDPIGFYAGDYNLYRYVGNHPTRGTDPFGRQQGNAGGTGQGNPGGTQQCRRNFGTTTTARTSSDGAPVLIPVVPQSNGAAADQAYAQAQAQLQATMQQQQQQAAADAAAAAAQSSNNTGNNTGNTSTQDLQNFFNPSDGAPNTNGNGGLPNANGGGFDMSSFHQ